MNWTEGRTKRLQQLKREGLTAKQIATELGGTTIGNVAGKISCLQRRKMRDNIVN